MNASHINVVSFGFRHGEPPPAQLVLDLRKHFRDPHASPTLRYMDAHDLPVRQAVLSTPGILELICAAGLLVDAYDAGPVDAPLTVAVGCAGGRHRAATVAIALADRLGKTGIPVRLEHRDLAKPVVERDGSGEQDARPRPSVDRSDLGGSPR
ncbi:ATPase [Kitasatospora phosalacinea]|uniref:RapZ C-terminal domain-containing protein n=1 Tax=Kitasatospora phosalacinea TaxID=2065 RepID=UPI003666FB25